MKKQVFRENERGGMNLGWLNARFSFSFAEFFNPNLMGFGALRVLNDDCIKAHSGFPHHPHENFEIITIVMEGELTHQDSIGNEKKIPAGEIQHMSAGKGIVHSEANNGEKDVRSFQIWILPRNKNTEPFYGQKKIDQELLLSSDGRNGSLEMNQDAFLSWKKSSESFSYKNYDFNNGVYIMVVEGEAIIDGEVISKRDAIGLENFSDEVVIEPKIDSTFLIIEVPLNM